ncbi:hypothetical protein CAEBREN_28476 [Caenorhabditis brenneri]|uniref:Uncharacterized protein n=1 Tax=Caenorhabditis brenneri TaxID=135651 RepID=G0M6Q4_CAEBE|nr:hypothetical protein CAEBREN_28476 [Caenorhabditis brenneri]
MHNEDNQLGELLARRKASPNGISPAPSTQQILDEV